MLEETSEGTGPFVDKLAAVVEGIKLSEFALDLFRLAFAESAEAEVEDACLDIVAAVPYIRLS